MEKTKKRVGIETARTYSRYATLLLWGSFLTLFLMCSLTPTASAATLYLSPTTGSYAVGSTFTVSVYVSSPDQSENAVSGTISFPPDVLQVTSVSKIGSIISLWVQDPSFSNSVGTVDFQGLTLNPGFIGARAKILDITFKVKAAGTVPVIFQSGSILANDGSGTNVLNGFGNAKFIAGNFESPTSQIVHTPSFNIIEVPPKDATDPQATFIFNTIDTTSSIDHYQIQIDTGAPILWKDDGTHRYTTPATLPGQHSLLVKVFDKAGNELADSATFTITPLHPPQIRSFPAELNSGDILVIKGTTDYPGAQVLISLQNKNSSNQYADPLSAYQSGSNPDIQSVNADQQGNFTLVWAGNLHNGVYKMSAEVVNSKGARSIPTTPVAMAVNPSMFFTIGSLAINFFALAIPLVALILVLLFMLWYGWRRFSLMRKRLRKEVRGTELAVHKAFGLLKEDVRARIKMLEKISAKRQLTVEEGKIITQLKQDLDNAESLVRKEFESIEKEVK